MKIFFIYALVLMFFISCDDSASSSGSCGDGVVDSGEECDGPNFDGRTCEGYGFIGGDLTCTENCQISTDSCVA
ncbi:hypothetical protein KJ865_00025, partial [Myxococcota bacterium]|nr:hypothetical protein [Myxococcota bacterium]